MELERAGDQGEVAAGLRGVSELPFLADVPFLAEQANVVAQGQESFEKFGGLCTAAGAQESVDEPEGAGEKDALAAGQTVVAVLGR